MQSELDIIAQLQALPGGFSQRSRIHTPLFYQLDYNTAAGQREQQAYNLSNSGYILDAIASHQEAAFLYKSDGKFLEAANNLSIAGQLCIGLAPDQLVGANLAGEQAISLLQDAISIHLQLGHIDHAYRDTEHLYTAVYHMADYALSHGNTERSLELRSLLKSLQQNAKQFSDHMQGREAPDAHCIGEAEAGFSDAQRIGTDNVSQCLTIIARDPVTHKTGLAHLNYETDLSGLDAFFARFNARKLQVRLVGARFDQDARSYANIREVSAYLSKMNLEILSADILGGDAAPSAFVIDPATFLLEEARPTHPDQNTAIAQAKALFIIPNRPLHTAFDFTQNPPEHAPHYFPPELLQTFREHYKGKDDVALAFAMERNQLYDRALSTGYMRALETAYHAAWNELSEALESAIQQHGVSNNAAESARYALQNTGFYIGANASHYNAPLKEAIKIQLFSETETDFSALSALTTSGTGRASRNR